MVFFESGPFSLETLVKETVRCFFLGWNCKSIAIVYSKRRFQTKPSRVYRRFCTSIYWQQKLKKLVKHLIGSATALGGVSEQFDFGVLVGFHRILESGPLCPISTHRKLFESFCEFAAAKFEVISLSEFRNRLGSGGDIGGTLVITFDDGYKDNIRIAAPILQRLGLPATFFVTTNFIGSSTLPDWDRKNGQHAEWMSWDDVAELERMGFEIGSHTLNHRCLSQLEPAEAWDEIEKAHRIVDDRLQKPVRHFAFPIGKAADMTEELRDRLPEAGIDTCLSCNGGVVMNDDSPLNLNRIGFSPWFISPQHFLAEAVACRREIPA